MQSSKQSEGKSSVERAVTSWRFQNATRMTVPLSMFLGSRQT